MRPRRRSNARSATSEGLPSLVGSQDHFLEGDHGIFDLLAVATLDHPLGPSVEHFDPEDRFTDGLAHMFDKPQFTISGAA